MLTGRRKYKKDKAACGLNPNGETLQGVQGKGSYLEFEGTNCAVTQMNGHRR